ncbi:MAG: folate-binding protein YgfZ [Marinospirillum sp.]|uniref:CAF17-like 4Fe-4S cluster assembly/insertion protein YgfZ n=1 Tax=Marinospirillum sp. TaxID=2183934 RepID=UPI001A103804|nr:hypothetical protein [Marinospirillum sp.]MBE0507646.1 folate-binding protein YgfZ [Marinospirillum sp.]
MSQVHHVPLNHLAVLELQGGQPDKLLQGQITADLRLLSPQQALPGLLCSLKGRVISSFDLVAFAADHLALILPADTLPLVHNHLKKFEPFFKTRLVDTTANYQLLGLSGDGLPALAAEVLGGWPATLYSQSTNEQTLLLQLPGSRARGLLLLKRETTDFAAIQQQLQQSTQAASTNDWNLLDIEIGRVPVDLALSDQYLPQMLNFQALGAISFKKGCYIGQEIVARAQYRGQVKKRLFRVQLPSTELTLPAALLDEEGKNLGELLLIATSQQGEMQALAVINIKAVEDQSTLYAESNGQRFKINLLDLPYDPESRRNTPFEAA